MGLSSKLSLAMRISGSEVSTFLCVLAATTQEQWAAPYWQSYWYGWGVQDFGHLRATEAFCSHYGCTSTPLGYH